MATYYIQVTNLDFPASGSPNEIEYQFEGIQNLDRIKEVGRTLASAEDAENSVSYNFAPPKVRIPMNWLLINGVNRTQMKNDKSRGTLVSSGIDDHRLKLDDVQAVDTGNDTVSVSGDQTDRLVDGNDIRIEGSTGNDDTYTIDSTSYDSGDDETDITVTGDITDSTADGRVFDGVVTIQEQILWLRTYIFNGTGGTKHRFYGPNFTDLRHIGLASDAGTPVSPENIRLPENVQNLNAQSANIDMPIAEAV